MRRYNLVVCGGTFDHFHKGHREFLRYVLSIGRRVLIGLTSDKYIKNSKFNPTPCSGQNSKLIEDFNMRKENILSFLKKERVLGRVEVRPINDIYIPKVWDSLPIGAIVVTKDTISSAEKINLKRKEQGKYPLKIEVSPLIKSDKNEYISSSKVRDGEINREGRSYVNALWLKQKLFITDRLRQELKKPFGSVLPNEVSCPHPRPFHLVERERVRGIITVGDVTTIMFNKLHLDQNISVIDFKIARKKEFSSLSELGFLGGEKTIKVTNPAGCLTPALFKAAHKLFKEGKDKDRTILLIDGEEDLSVLPLTLFAPLGSLIFYGQPGKGIVKIEVSEKIKEKAFSFVNQFKLAQ